VELKIGQVGGLGVDKQGYLHIFHRADREWEGTTFDENNTFTKQAEGPIKQPTMFTVNSTNGIVLSKWAANFFYLPHGLSIDHHGFFWMTDVALHQVFKFEEGKDKPLLTLGKAFEAARSNDDMDRFCKPTDVAVASNDDFFVSDGYCNSRVVKYDSTGKLIGQFGLGDFQVAHSLALAEDLNLICVADRENMRILCYNAGLTDKSKLGEPEREYNDESLGRVFAITYSPVDGLLYGVTGPTGVLPSQGFTIDLREDERYSVDLIATWLPDDKGFDQPHAIAVGPDGEPVFVGETKPDVVWKFVKEQQPM
jgi:peptidylamidoglycolate lyase